MAFSLFQFIKNRLESSLGMKIYRDSLPHGTDLFVDLSRVKPLSTFSTVIDIGVHKGQSITAYLKGFPSARVLGYEASRQSFELLQKQFQNQSRVQLRRVAVSSQNGEATLYLNASDAANSLIKSTKSVSQETVPASKLDDLCAEAGVSHVDFCKIDTEGHDLEVLAGAGHLLQHQAMDFIHVETSIRRDVDYFVRFEEVDRVLSGFSYELLGIYDQQTCWTGRGSLLFFNAVYVRSSLVDTAPPI
jgi:FkbM family methyltransferase